MSLLPDFAAGFFLGLSLIVAIGAQNAFILRQGLLKRHVLILCSICAVSDAALILAGVLGLGALVEQFPQLISFVTIGGAVFLFTYGAMAARRALKPSSMEEGANLADGPPLKAAVLTVLAFTFLNPHVYLDTFILVGGISTGYQGASLVAFTFGAMSASFAWFFSLGYGAQLLTPLFQKPKAWQILDGLIALIMFAIGFSLFVRFFSL